MEDLQATATASFAPLTHAGPTILIVAATTTINIVATTTQFPTATIAHLHDAIPVRSTRMGIAKDTGIFLLLDMILNEFACLLAYLLVVIIIAQLLVAIALTGIIALMIATIAGIKIAAATNALVTRNHAYRRVGMSAQEKLHELARVRPRQLKCLRHAI